MPKSPMPQTRPRFKEPRDRSYDDRPRAYEARQASYSAWRGVTELGIKIGRVIEARSEYSHEGNRTYPITLSAGLRSWAPV